MILRLIMRPKPEPARAGMFGYPPLPRRRFGFGLLVSCTLHATFIAALSTAAYWQRPAEPWIPPGYTVEMLRVVVPPRLYYSRPRQTGDGRAALPRSVAAARTAGAGMRPSAAAMLRLPDRAARLRSPVVLIQPELSRSAAPPDLRLPDLFAWSRHDALVPPAPIVPGHAGNAAGRPSAAPVLQPSNAQERVGPLNVEPRAAAPVPALPMPPQSTTPVHFAGADNSQSDRRISLDTRDADPANLLSSSERSPRPGEVIPVPAGVNAAAGAPDGRAPAPPAAAQRNAAPQTANRADASPGENAKPARRVTAGASAAGGSVADAAAAPTITAGRESAAPSHESGRPPASPAATAAAEPPGPPPPEGAIWKEHPKGGQFDVVVVQASSSPDTREAGFVLGGPQVYTVYVEVGTERPWVLQFCKPAEAAVEQNRGGVVRITAGGRIDAPYPILTAVPTPALVAASAKIYVRGFLNVEGRLEDLSVLGLAGAAAHDLVALLGKWRFRPAMEADRALRVEVLFTIPAVDG